MARPPRVDFPGAWHHVMNRGARRAPIFELDEHCSLFLDCVGEACERFGLEVHAYALMPNHYHLLVRSPLGTLSRAMRRIGANYTQSVNRMTRWDGPIFRGRFRNQLLDSDGAVLMVAAYIHLNPVRAGLVHRLDARCWTSHRTYLELEPGCEWLHRGFVLAQADGPSGFRSLVRDLRRGRRSWPDGFDAEAGWFSDDSKPGPWSLHGDAQRPPAREPEQAKDVLTRIVAHTGVGPKEIRRTIRGRGGNPARRFAVWALARATMLTQAAIGEQLQLSPTRVANILATIEQTSDERVQAWMAQWRAGER